MGQGARGGGGGMGEGVCYVGCAPTHPCFEPSSVPASSLTQAKLYEARHEMAAAEQLYCFNLSRLDAAGLPLGQDAVEALLFLAARYKVGVNTWPYFPHHSGNSTHVSVATLPQPHCPHFQETGRLAESRAACERLMDVGGPAKERAKALARELHALQQQQLQAEDDGGGDGASVSAAAAAVAAASASHLRQQQQQQASPQSTPGGW